MIIFSYTIHRRLSSLNKRFEYVDILKGIGILFVVLAHFSITPNFLKVYIYSFHMPLFFFISGYLLKIKPNVSSKDIFLKKIKSLLIPYLWFELILFIFTLSMTFVSNKVIKFPDYLISVFYGNKLYDENYMGALWFLLCLCVTEIIFYYLYSTVKNRLLLTFIIISLSIFGYYYSTLSLIRLPFTLEISFIAISFYGLGYVFRGSNIQKWILNNSNLAIPCFFCINICFVFLNYSYNHSGHLHGRVDMLYLSYNNYFYFYLASISGILFYYLISKYLENLNPVILKYLGMNTLLIMALHIPILMVLQKVLEVLYKTFNFNFTFLTGGLILFITILIINSIIGELIKKYFPFMLNNKVVK
jgi:acyltransferase